MLASGQTTGGYLGLIEFLATAPKADMLIVEDFILRRGRAMSSDQTAPERGIGAAAAFAHIWGIPMTLITPAQNKTIPDSALKALNLWGQPGHDNRHQRDASRLTVKYLTNKNHQPTIERIYHAH